MANDTEKWGALFPLAEQVSKKTIDGFEMPFEMLNLAGTEWPHEGGSIVRFNTRQGVLLFRDGAHENYGYFSPRDFASAAKKNALRAKTIPGAISLGRARAVLNKPLHIHLSIKGLWTDLRFYAETSEEALQMRDFLRNIYPESKINISENAVKLALTTAFSFNIFEALKDFHLLLPRQKRAIFTLSGIGLATIILAIMTPLKLIPSGFDILAFVLLIIALISLFPQLTPEPPKENTPSQEG